MYKLCFLLCYVCTLASVTPPPNSAPQLTSNGARLLLPPPTTRVQRGPFPCPFNSPPTRSVILPPPPARTTHLQRGPRLCHHSRPCESPPTNPAPCFRHDLPPTRPVILPPPSAQATCLQRGPTWPHQQNLLRLVTAGNVAVLIARLLPAS